MSPPRAALAALLGLIALGGCEYPTTAPIVGQRWILPAEITTIRVAQLLPPGVADNGNTFAVTVAPLSASESLATLCASCADGVTAPKPAFTGEFGTGTSLPPDVSATTLSSGSVAVAVHNGFDFDPIRPGAGHTGTLTVTLTDGPDGRELGRIVIDGATEALPPGSTLSRTLSLEAGPFGPVLYASVRIVSPTGDPISIDSSQRMTVRATTSSLLVSSARVDVEGRSVTLDSASLDVADIDRTVVDAVEHGGLVLDIENPFGVSLAATMHIAGGGITPIVKSFNVPADETSTATVSFTGEELKSFLGKSDVQLTGGGVVSSPRPVTLGPAQKIRIEGKLDLSLSFGG